MLPDRRHGDTAGNAGSTATARLVDQIAGRILSRPSRVLELRGESPAGVLALLFPDREHGLSTLLTRRTDEVRDHKGQISFPGGVRDATDPDLAVTALRETREELGIERSAVCLVGRLDDYKTMTGYLIRPFVGWLPGRPRVTPSAVEIAETMYVPLARLVAPGVHELRRVESGGRTYETHVFTVGEHVVWGATATILVDLLNRIEELL